MYENPEAASSITHDDAERQESAERGMDTNSSLITTGVGGGWMGYYDPPWQRLRWEELSARTGDPIVPPDYPPCRRAFPSATTNGAWPISIDLPLEGSIDEPTFVRLSEVLNELYYPEQTVYVHYCELQFMEFDEPYVLRGTLKDLTKLTDGPAMSSPHNMWPDDRSWVTYTDFDLWGTKIVGTPELEKALESDPEFETIRIE
ncbi:hypothetical protein [Haloglycomyces albus]|uniref:hypothetical protein n=1 Tax=Haloglycomyces albus TaxID=526067 RepID=UPI0004B4C5D4|nr:hypothetical protein [Haloglycomyces albus]